MTKLACLVLAAGKAGRFGSPKQLFPIHGKPMICHVLDSLAPIFSHDLFCVVGAYRDEIAPLIADKAHLIENESWQLGMGTSISKGIEHIRAQNAYDGLLIALADQIALKTEDFQGLLNLFDDDSIVAATYEGQQGVPAIFPASMFNDLQALSQDFGARKLLKETDKTIISHKLPLGTFDIDTPENLLAYLNLRLRSG
jgi:molybdenum cofactor cytidylyltransferase